MLRMLNFKLHYYDTTLIEVICYRKEEHLSTKIILPKFFFKDFSPPGCLPTFAAKFVFSNLHIMPTKARRVFSFEFC